MTNDIKNDAETWKYAQQAMSWYGFPPSALAY